MSVHSPTLRLADPSAHMDGRGRSLAGKPISVCPHDCPSVCQVAVDLDPDSGQVSRLHGGRINAYTDGVLCAKVARYNERIHHPDRLTQPLIRRGDKGDRNGFEPIEWDTALDIVAEAFLKAEQHLGAETVWPYFYAGTMGLVHRDGIHRLRHAKGYSRQGETICTGYADAGWSAGVGKKVGIDSREMVDADLIVIWGCNAVHTQVQVMNWVAKARKQRGAKLVVVDPYRNATAEKADLHVMPRPGTDGALACAVMAVMLEEGLADRAYMDRLTDDPSGLAAHLASRGPDWAEGITGIPADEIRTFARLYGSTKRSFLRIGYGFTRQRNGSAAMHAVSCLPAVSGAWAHPGGGALFGNSALFPLNTEMITGDSLMDPSVREIDMSRIGPALCGEAEALSGGPPVTAMIIQNTNPVVVAPDSALVRQGFARNDLFTCVHEQFLTETAAMADLVLPATMFLEHSDLYKASGHTYLQTTKPVIAPPEGCRSNHDVLCALAGRLGVADRHPGFGLSDWQVMDAVLAASGLPDAQTIYEAGGLDGYPEDFETAHLLNGFPNSSGKFRFRAKWRGDGAAAMPEWPDHLPVTEEVSDDTPFRLVTAPARHYLNSSFTETPGSQRNERRPEVMIHPEVAAGQGITAGDWVRLSNRRGSVRLHARLFDGLPRDVLVVESIWPNAAFADGQGINTLVGGDRGIPNGGAPFHDTAVALSRAGSDGETA